MAIASRKFKHLQKIFWYANKKKKMDRSSQVKMPLIRIPKVGPKRSHVFSPRCLLKYYRYRHQISWISPGINFTRCGPFFERL